MLKFHILFIFNCEELVRIRVICEGLVRIFLDVNNWYSILTNVKNRYQFFTPVKNLGSILCREHTVALQVLSFLLGLAISDKKSFTNIDKEKLVAPPGGHIFKTVK